MTTSVASKPPSAMITLTASTNLMASLISIFNDIWHPFLQRLWRSSYVTFFLNLRVKSQMSIAPEDASTEKSNKLSFLIPLRAI